MRARLPALSTARKSNSAGAPCRNWLGADADGANIVHLCFAAAHPSAAESMNEPRQPITANPVAHYRRLASDARLSEFAAESATSRIMMIIVRRRSRRRQETFVPLSPRRVSPTAVRFLAFHLWLTAASARPKRIIRKRTLVLVSSKKEHLARSGAIEWRDKQPKSKMRPPRLRTPRHQARVESPQLVASKRRRWKSIRPLAKLVDEQVDEST